jgi:signal transduction histidine kinase
VIDELLFGRRPDPLGAASQVAGHLGEDPRAALDTVRTALVLPYVALVVGGTEIAASGSRVSHVRRLPLRLHDADGTDAGLGKARGGGDSVVGPPGHDELLVGLRPGDLDLTRDDRRVLRLVTPLLVQTLRASALVAEVQASREGTVTAVEEERRRLRRDLHDGLGPRLSGMAFTTDAARNLLRTDPDAADSLLVGLRAEAVAAIKDVRDIAYGLRPPALDELGLVPAILQQTTRLRTPDGRAFLVRVDAVELPPLPAAVEVAAYRIAVEALTNAARHSGHDNAHACLKVDGSSLLVEVRDAGSNPAPWPPGVGTASMRERAKTVGGTLLLEPSPRGSAVRAALPLAPSTAPHVDACR